MKRTSMADGSYLGARLPRFSKGHCISPTFLSFNPENGHARICIDEVNELGLSTLAHRLLVQIKGGLIGSTDTGEPLRVLHMCGNSSCVNDEHLQLGTDAQNSRDRKFHEKNLPFFHAMPIDIRLKYLAYLSAEGVEFDCPEAVAMSPEVSPVKRYFSAFRPRKCYYSPLTWVSPDTLRRILYCVFFGPSTHFSHKEQIVVTTCGDYNCINVLHFKELGPYVPQMDAYPHWNSKLTYGQIQAIQISELPRNELALAYGVTPDTIGKKKRGY